MNHEKNGSFITVTIIIALATAIFYLSIYVFEVSYCSIFGIPNEIVDLSKVFSILGESKNAIFLLYYF